MIVGATGGIGRALVEALLADGQTGRVWALSRSGAAPEGAMGLTMDLEDEASLARAAARIFEGPAPTRIVIATGVLHDGYRPERTYRALSAEHMMRDFRINAVGPALAIQALGPLLPRDRRAVLAALSARVGSISDNRLGGWHAYRASKAALNMILKTVAVEMARTHPQALVAGLHPGTVDTALSAPFQGGVQHQRLFDPAFAAARLIAVMDQLAPTDSGSVFAWDGQRIAP